MTYERHHRITADIEKRFMGDLLEHQLGCPYEAGHFKRAQSEESLDSEDDTQYMTCPDRRCCVWYDLHSWFGVHDPELKRDSFELAFTDIAHGGSGLYEKLVVLGHKTLETFSNIYIKKQFDPMGIPFDLLNDTVVPLEVCRRAWTAKRVERLLSAKCVLGFAKAYLTLVQLLPTDISCIKYVKACIGYSAHKAQDDPQLVLEWLPCLVEHMYWVNQLDVEDHDEDNYMLEDIQYYFGYSYTRLIPRIRELLTRRSSMLHIIEPTGEDIVRHFATKYFTAMASETCKNEEEHATWIQNEVTHFMQSPALQLFAGCWLNLSPYFASDRTSQELPSSYHYRQMCGSLVAACYSLCSEEKSYIWMTTFIHRLRQIQLILHLHSLEKVDHHNSKEKHLTKSDEKPEDNLEERSGSQGMSSSYKSKEDSIESFSPVHAQEQKTASVSTHPHSDPPDKANVANASSVFATVGRMLLDCLTSTMRTKPPPVILAQVNERPLELKPLCALRSGKENPKDHGKACDFTENERVARYNAPDLPYPDTSNDFVFTRNKPRGVPTGVHPRDNFKVRAGQDRGCVLVRHKNIWEHKPRDQDGTELWRPPGAIFMHPRRRIKFKTHMSTQQDDHLHDSDASKNIPITRNALESEDRSVEESDGSQGYRSSSLEDKESDDIKFQIRYRLPKGGIGESKETREPLDIVMHSSMAGMEHHKQGLLRTVLEVGPKNQDPYIVDRAGGPSQLRATLYPNTIDDPSCPIRLDIVNKGPTGSPRMFISRTPRNEDIESQSQSNEDSPRCCCCNSFCGSCSLSRNQACGICTNSHVGAPTNVKLYDNDQPCYSTQSTSTGSSYSFASCECDARPPDDPHPASVVQCCAQHTFEGHSCCRDCCSKQRCQPDSSFSQCCMCNCECSAHRCAEKGQSNETDSLGSACESFYSRSSENDSQEIGKPWSTTTSATTQTQRERDLEADRITEGHTFHHDRMGPHSSESHSTSIPRNSLKDFFNRKHDENTWNLLPKRQMRSSPLGLHHKDSSILGNKPPRDDVSLVSSYSHKSSINSCCSSVNGLQHRRSTATLPSVHCNYSDNARTNTSNGMPNSISKETSTATLSFTSKGMSNATSSFTSRRSSNSTLSFTSEGASHFTSRCISNATSNSTSGFFSNVASNSTSNARSNVTSTSTSNARSNVTSTSTSSALSNGTTTSTSDALSNPTSNSTSTIPSDSISRRTSTAMSNSLSSNRFNTTSGSASDSTLSHLSNVTSNTSTNTTSSSSSSTTSSGLSTTTSSSSSCSTSSCPSSDTSATSSTNISSCTSCSSSAETRSTSSEDTPRESESSSYTSTSSPFNCKSLYRGPSTVASTTGFSFVRMPVSDDNTYMRNNNMLSSPWGMTGQRFGNTHVLTTTATATDKSIPSGSHLTEISRTISSSTDDTTMTSISQLSSLYARRSRDHRSVSSNASLTFSHSTIGESMSNTAGKEVRSVSKLHTSGATSSLLDQGLSSRRKSDSKCSSDSTWSSKTSHESKQDLGDISVGTQNQNKHKAKTKGERHKKRCIQKEKRSRVNGISDVRGYLKHRDREGCSGESFSPHAETSYGSVKELKEEKESNVLSNDNDSYCVSNAPSTRRTHDMGFKDTVPTSSLTTTRNILASKHWRTRYGNEKTGRLGTSACHVLFKDSHKTHPSVCHRNQTQGHRGYMGLQAVYHGAPPVVSSVNCSMA